MRRIALLLCFCGSPAFATAAPLKEPVVRAKQVEPHPLAQKIGELGKRLEVARGASLSRLYSESEALLREVETQQDRGSLSVQDELAAARSAARLIEIVDRIDPKVVHGKHRDRVETIGANAQYRATVDNHETAVEIESILTDKILAAMTTKDGTVGPILAEGRKAAPAFLQALGGNGGPNVVKWDALSRDQKLELLRSQSKGRYFFSDRRIPGVIFRRTLTTESGPLHVGDHLLERVEYSGPRAVDEVSDIEFHVRQRGRASQNAKSAFKLIDVFQSEAEGGHQHIPGRIPESVLKGDALDRFRLVDFFRRATVTAELASILDGYQLKHNVDADGVHYFDYLPANAFGTINRYLESRSQGSAVTLGKDQLKEGAIGFRPGEVYGDPNMFGFEFRMLDLNAPHEEQDAFLDSVQKGVLTGSYGLSKSALERWYSPRVEQADVTGWQDRTLESLHYNRNLYQMLANPPQALAHLITARVRTRLLGEGATDNGIKLLVHDWSSDPVLLDGAQAKQIEGAQQAALEALGRGEPASEVVRNFVKSSHLYDLFSDSLGMHPRK